MEFWGVEVKAGQPLKVKPDYEEVIHVSQATLGESKKKGDESVPIYVKFEDKKLVLGTLSADKFPQVSFDLVFEKEFELSHNWNGGSVYFMGYKSVVSDENDFSDMGTDSDDDDLPMSLEENGKSGPQSVAAKPALGNANAKAKSAEKPKARAEVAKGKGKDNDSDEDNNEDDDEDDDSTEDDSDNEEESDSEADSDDEEDDSDEDDEEETPKKAEVGKKRPSEPASRTPDAKKAKLTTPQKTDGKKGGHSATPHPAKQGVKIQDSKKQQQQTPKSGGSVTCKSCSKTFNSENALQSHSKAKHGAK